MLDMKYTCVVEDCGKATPYKLYCWKHYQRLRTTGSLDLVKPRGAKYKAHVGYKGAHGRVYKLYGSALYHFCSCNAQGQEWSYAGGGPCEHDSPDGPYSCLPEYYEPLCVPCHRARDGALGNFGARLYRG